MAAESVCRETGKVIHDSRGAAETHSRSLKRKDGDPLETYPCEHCHGWHVGHPKFSARQNRFSGRIEHGY
jgi:hypothetical protein